MRRRRSRGPQLPTRWCPKCGAEYRPGFTFCAGCRVDLVDDEPLARAPKAAGARTGTPFRPHCPRCGVPFPTLNRGLWLETSVKCGECGVAVGIDSAPLPPSKHEVAYRLDELALIERAVVTADLIDDHIPFRWEDGLVLVVPTAVEDRVDRLIDDVTAP